MGWSSGISSTARSMSASAHWVTPWSMARPASFHKFSHFSAMHIIPPTLNVLAPWTPGPGPGRTGEAGCPALAFAGGLLS